MVVGVVVQVRQPQERLRWMAGLGEVLEDVVERRQDGQLDDQREASDQASERVDPVFLVELHHLRVQLGRVFLELLAEVGYLRGELALLDHRLALRHQLELLKGRQDQADDDGQDDDRDPICADRLDDRNALQVHVQVAQEPLERMLDYGHPDVVDRRQKIADAFDQIAQVRVSDEGWKAESGDRIVAALGEWMAARDAHRSHPATAQPAVFLDRFVRVMGARRVVAAGRRKDLGKGHLVTPNQSQEQPRHEFSLDSRSAAWCASAASSANVSSKAAGRAMRTTSYRIPTLVSGESAPKKLRRASSRSRRRARLRSTELLRARLTVTPTRLCSRSLATFASAVLHDAHSAPGAHPAQETVHATAIAFLGLEGSLDGGPLKESRTGENRGSVPEPGHSDLDSAIVTSSAEVYALRCPQGFATLPARKQTD